MIRGLFHGSDVIVYFSRSDFLVQVGGRLSRIDGQTALGFIGKGSKAIVKLAVTLLSS
ncbi:MAG: hypothetical protein HRU05_07730 [Oceanospirillaceae bacterium]|nr:hypothetical protein [Oceanospirillaceae bacterium]